jgi:hypothetical protein
VIVSKAPVKHDLSQWVDVGNECDIHEFARELRIGPEPLGQASLGSVLMIPTHKSLYEHPPQYNLFPFHTKPLMHLLRGHRISASIYDDGKEKRELVLRSADIVLPILMFVGGAAVSVSLGILSNWIYACLANRRKDPTVQVEYAILDLTGITRWRKLEGPATAVAKLLKEESIPTLQKKSKGIVHSNPTNANSNNADRHQAKKAMRAAKTLREQADACYRSGNRKEAEQLFRTTLAKIREAVLWEPSNESYRNHLHVVGRGIHDRFGCIIKFEDKSYQVDCPVMLSHSKGGFSIGGPAKVLCSICEDNFLDCPHVPGERYSTVATKIAGNTCNICCAESCSHVQGQLYEEVWVTGIVVDMSLDHVAYVDRPADPLCCVHKYSLSKIDILKELSEEEKAVFVYGETPLHCHHCIRCKGANRADGRTSGTLEGRIA